MSQISESGILFTKPNQINYSLDSENTEFIMFLRIGTESTKLDKFDVFNLWDILDKYVQSVRNTKDIEGTPA